MFNKCFKHVGEEIEVVSYRKTLSLGTNRWYTNTKYLMKCTKCGKEYHQTRMG